MADAKRRRRGTGATTEASAGPSSESIADAAIEARRASMLGALAGGLIAAFFVYPGRAFPVENLLLSWGLPVVALAVCLRAFGADRRALAEAAGSFPAMCLFGFVVWTAIRTVDPRVPAIDGTGLVRIPAPGREATLGAVATVPALALGLGLGAGERRRPGALRAFRLVLTVAALGFALHAFHQYFVGYDRDLALLRAEIADPENPGTLMEQSLLHALREKRVGGRLGNANVFAALMAVLCAAAVPAIRARGRAERAIAGAAILAATAAILLSQSRGGVLTWGFAAVAWGAAEAGRRRWGGDNGRARVVATVALVLAAFMAATSAREAAAAGLFERLGKTNSVRERLFYWDVAARLWAERPATGAGPGAFQLRYPGLKPAEARESRYAHSWVMHLGAETGAIGLGAFAAFVAGTAWRARRIREGGAAAAAIPFLALAFNGLFEYTLQTPEFLALLAALGGIAIGLGAGEDGAGGEAGKRIPARWRSIPGAAAAIVAVWGLGILAPGVRIAAFWDWEAREAARDGDFSGAAERHARARRWEPSNEGHLAGEALALVRTGPAARERAREGLREACAANPLSARLRAEWASLEASEGRWAEAGRLWDEAVILHPMDAGYRLDRAEYRLARGDREGARTDWETIRRENLPIWPYQRDRFERLSGVFAASPGNRRD